MGYSRQRMQVLQLQLSHVLSREDGQPLILTHVLHGFDEHAIVMYYLDIECFIVTPEQLDTV